MRKPLIIATLFIVAGFGIMQLTFRAIEAVNNNNINYYITTTCEKIENNAQTQTWYECNKAGVSN